MGSISIRKLDDDVIRRLRIRAAEKNISMEEEVRRILREATAEATGEQENIVDLARKYFGPEHGIELEIPEHEPHEPLDFSE